MPIPNGARVRQVVPVIEGTVEKKRVHDEADQIEYLVKFSDPNGNPQTRWFLETQITEVPA